MYPDSFFQWLGSIAIVFGLLIASMLLAWLLYSGVEKVIDRWEHRHDHEA